MPKASRHNAGQLLSLLLNDITAKPEEIDNWTRLMLFAFCCLDAPKRGGKKHTKSLSARINAKVREFHTNKLMRPEAAPSTPKIESKRKQKPQELSELVSAKIEEGDLKGAIRLASSAETMAPNDKATLLLLRSKHPVLRRIPDRHHFKHLMLSPIFQPPPVKSEKRLNLFLPGLQQVPLDSDRRS